MSGRRERMKTPDSSSVPPPFDRPMEPLLISFAEPASYGRAFLDAEFTSPCVRSSVGIDDCSVHFSRDRRTSSPTTT